MGSVGFITVSALLVCTKIQLVRLACLLNSRNFSSRKYASLPYVSHSPMCKLQEQDLNTLWRLLSVIRIRLHRVVCWSRRWSRSEEVCIAKSHCRWSCGGTFRKYALVSPSGVSTVILALRPNSMAWWQTILSLSSLLQEKLQTVSVTFKECVMWECHQGYFDQTGTGRFRIGPLRHSESYRLCL